MSECFSRDRRRTVSQYRVWFAQDQRDNELYTQRIDISTLLAEVDLSLFIQTRLNIGRGEVVRGWVGDICWMNEWEMLNIVSGIQRPTRSSLFVKTFFLSLATTPEKASGQPHRRVISSISLLPFYPIQLLIIMRRFQEIQQNRYSTQVRLLHFSSHRLFWIPAMLSMTARRRISLPTFILLSLLWAQFWPF